MPSMTIDIHTHPVFFEPISENQEELEFRREILGLYKHGKAPLQHIFNQMKCAGLDKIILLPLDLTSLHEGAVVSNEQIRKLVDLSPDKFIGFASIDPYREDALEVLEYAFTELKLSGLKLHPSRQQFYPYEAFLKPIYEMCINHKKPIMFHAGISWGREALSKYARPILFEEVASRYPKLKICLAHFGWPWVKETAALLLKYTNVYADTALLYFDSAKEFYKHVFTKELEMTWIDRSLRHQVMFGSNNPRFEQIRMLDALGKIGFRDSTLELIRGKNALEFLGMEGD
ncbi:amidohydrolase family protein [Scopulibacillus cellulosilyticus]|uniref:Amidohydrolase family protein n=1 Tax=Scopulibacillus cellulosilyticus TaxID=2665665 RepID=A0ABW2Q0F4_9BACL